MIAPADARPARLLRERPSIRLLLLVTAMTAVAVWLLQPPSTATTLEAVVSVFAAPFYGVALAALLIAAIAVGRRTLDTYGASEPGHWLLFIHGAGFAGVTLFWRTIINLGTQVWLVMPGLFLGGFLLLVTAILIFASLYEGVTERRWRAVFWLLAAVVPIPFACGCCSLPFGVPDSQAEFFALTALLGIVGGMLLATIVASAKDIALRQPRDLWHWAGVACLFATVFHVALLVLVVVPRQYARM